MCDNEKYFRRNFNLGVLNGTLFNAALAFLSGSTILPVFLSRLTDSKALIGLFSTMDSFGWAFPQLFSAIFIAHRTRVLGFYNSLSSLRLLFFALAIGSIFLFDQNSPALLIAFGGSFTLLSMAAGISGVAFTEVVGKTIPVNKRGSYFGWRMFLGGSMAAVGGIVARQVIAAYPYPQSFGYLYIIGWGLMLLGLVSFACIKEPATREALTQAHPKTQLKSAIAIYHGDSNFRQLFWSRACVNTYYLAMPFYIVFAMNRLGAPVSYAGIYLTAQMTGYLGSNIFWGSISNHRSNRLVIILAGIVSAMPPLIGLAASIFPISPLAFAAVFFLLGATESGVGIGYVNYLLEISPEKGRVLTIGLMNTLIAPTFLFSALGGFLSQEFSIRMLFAAVFITTVLSVAISGRLKEPRVKFS